MSIYDEVVQKIADSTMAWRGKAPPGFGAAPVAETAAEVGGAVARKVPFYNRPIGSFKGLGAGLMGKGGVIGTAIGGSLMAGDYLQNTVEPALVNKMAGPGIAGPEAQPYLPTEAQIAARGVKAPGAVPPTAQPADAKVGNVWYSPQAMDAMNAVKGLPEMQGRIADESAAGVAPPNYQPIQSKDTYDESGNLVNRAITGRGTPPGYGAREQVIPDLTGIGGLIGMKQAANQNAITAKRDIAAATLQQNALLKMPAAQQAELSNRIALRMMDPNVTDEERGRLSNVAAALHGRIGAQEKLSVPMGIQPLSPDAKNPVANVFNPRTGGVQSVAIKPPAPTEADIQKTMAARKMTREQVLARLKSEGRM